MKIRLSIIVILVLASSSAIADDIRTKVVGSEISGMDTPIIDPEHHVYGTPWDTGEDEFIDRWGKPAGYIRLSAQETGMIYGRRHLFVFKNMRLAGLRVTHNVLDWQISRKMLPHPLFDSIQWQLVNGIQEETNLAEVKKILGTSLSQERYERFYTTHHSKVTINFSHYTDAGNGDEAYKVHGIMIERK